MVPMAHLLETIDATMEESILSESLTLSPARRSFFAVKNAACN
jgi:hypothetical protein